MNKKSELLKLFSPHLFWSVDKDKLDTDRHKEYIIENVMNYGLEKDEFLLYQIYPHRVLRKILPRLDSLNEAATAYSSAVFNIKETKFKCYAKKLSHVN
ncbi:MAG: hypothetical protein LBH44_04165 [Treponema sp.]|jgi:hypothetical protein|nr:hypothetical protein [Treponema sp.]